MKLNLDIYDDLQIEDTPVNPTVFYNIKPIVKNNSAEKSESISSFLIRLSNLHVVSINKLLSLLIPGLQFHEQMQKVNYDGTIQRIIINKLEEFTGVEGLNNNTLLTWGNIISTTNSLRKHKAWCAICFQEMQDYSQVIYEKLIWLVKDYRVCTEHRVELDTKCQYCMEPQKILPNKSAIGYCLKCKKWLGRGKGPKGVEFSSSDEIFIHAVEIESFLEYSINKNIDRDKLNAALACIHKNIIDRTRGFSRKFYNEYFNINHNGLLYEYDINGKISLKVLLIICMKLKIDIVDLIEYNFESVYIDDADLLPYQDTEIIEYLRSISEGNEYMSLAKLSRIIRVPKATLKANYTELANKILENNALLIKPKQTRDFLPLKERDYNGVQKYLNHIISTLTYRTLSDITGDVKIPSETLRKKFPRELEKIFWNNKILLKQKEMEHEELICKLWGFIDSEVVMSLQDVLESIGSGYDNLSKKYSYLFKKIEQKASKDISVGQTVISGLNNRNAHEVYNQIKREIMGITDKPKYLKEFAEELNIPVHKLREAFPLLIRELKQRNIMVSKQNTLAKNKYKLREFIIKLYKEGEYPSIPRIKSKMDFEEEELKIYRLQIFEELGIAVNAKWYPDEIDGLD